MRGGEGDQPGPPYRVELRNRHVEADWQELKRTRADACQRLVKHLQNSPRVRIGTRYVPMRGNQKYTEFKGEPLPQWQYEIDNRARVKVAIGADFVVIVAVSTGHPKENE